MKKTTLVVDFKDISVMSYSKLVSTLELLSITSQKVFDNTIFINCGSSIELLLRLYRRTLT